MSNMSIEFEIPPGIDAERLRRDVAALVANERYRVDSEASARACLEGDGGFERWVSDFRQNSSPPRMRDVPIVRACRYEKVSFYQEVGSYWPWPKEFKKDPRRPVFIRGARAVLGLRHDKNPALYKTSWCDNGWLERVAERYLRFTKYTCFCAIQHDYRMHDLSGRWYQRGRDVCGGHFRHPTLRGVQGDGTQDAWVNGRHHWSLTREQVRRLKKMHGIRDKAEIAESRADRIQRHGPQAAE